jgi:DNA modification methylase
MTEQDYFEVKDENKFDVQPGDVWILGRHRLVCADSRYPSTIEILMDGQKADMIFTDPPYGVAYNQKNEFLNKIHKGNSRQDDITNDDISDYRKFFSDFLGAGGVHLKQENSIYITMSGNKLKELNEAFDDQGIKWGQVLVWVKNNHVLGRQDYANKCEFIVYGWKGKHKFYGGFQTTVWQCKKPLISKLHPTMKPLEIIEMAILNSTKTAGTVLDMFGGSGSTLIACEQLGRTCFMAEIEPKYCSVIIDRWQTYTRKKARKFVRSI